MLSGVGNIYRLNLSQTHLCKKKKRCQSEPNLKIRQLIQVLKPYYFHEFSEIYIFKFIKFRYHVNFQKSECSEFLMPEKVTLDAGEFFFNFLGANLNKRKNKSSRMTVVGIS